MKTTFSITFHGTSRKAETIEIEATDMAIIDGAECDLVCWTLAKRTVFAIPFKSFIQSQVIKVPKEVKVSTPNVTKLSVVRRA